MSFITDVGKLKKKKKMKKTKQNKQQKKKEWLKAYLSTVTILYVLSFYATFYFNSIRFQESSFHSIPNQDVS